MFLSSIKATAFQLAKHLATLGYFFLFERVENVTHFVIIYKNGKVDVGGPVQSSPSGQPQPIINFFFSQ